MPIEFGEACLTFKRIHMKKITIFACMMLSIFASWANNSNTRLVVEGNNATVYNLYIDGQIVGDSYKQNNSYVVHDIDNSTYQIRLSKWSSGIFGGNRERIIYNSNLSFRSGEELVLWVDLFGNVSVTARSIQGNGGWGNNNGNWNGNNNGNWNGNNGCRKGHGRHGKKRKDCNRGCDRYSAILNTMDQNTFENLKQQVTKECFDDRKLSTINLAMQNYSFSTAQVSTLMKQFSFDSKRVEFAKLAYPNVIDQQNYFMLSKEFTFDSSKRELEAYLRNA